MKKFKNELYHNNTSWVEKKYYVKILKELEYYKIGADIEAREHDKLRKVICKVIDILEEAL